MMVLVLAVSPAGWRGRLRSRWAPGGLAVPCWAGGDGGGGRGCRYYLAHACCPVLAIPPPSLAQQAGDGLRGWAFRHRWARIRRAIDRVGRCSRLSWPGDGEHRAAGCADDLFGDAAPGQAGEGRFGAAGQHDQVSGPYGTVQLWDVATQRQITTLTGPAGAVNSVVFSRDGKTLAAGSADHAVRLWDVAYLGNAVPHLCASAGRSLTRAEWARYAPVLAYQKVCP